MFHSRKHKEQKRREALEAEKAAARAVLREAGIKPEAATQLPPQPLHAEEGHPPSPQPAAQGALGATTTPGAAADAGAELSEDGRVLARVTAVPIGQQHDGSTLSESSGDPPSESKHRHHLQRKKHSPSKQQSPSPRSKAKRTIAEKIQDKMAAGLYAAIAKVLNRALGQYIDGIDKDSFHLSAGKGVVELSNLSLRPEAFHALNLPLELSGSHIGSLKLDIPAISRLKTQPLVVELYEIFATLRPSPDIDMAQVKRSQLTAHDAKWAAAGEETDDAEDEGADKKSGGSLSWMDSIQQKIVDNIQFVMQDLHIRYEDPLTSQRSSWIADQGCVFAAGITLDRIEMKSFLVDTITGMWEQRFVKEQQRCESP
jgi:hypothetical protein